MYRMTAHATTNTPPCELLMGHSLRTRLDLLRPNLQRKVLSEQAKQKQSHDKHSKDRQFKEGDTVTVYGLEISEITLIRGKGRTCVI